VASLAKIQNPIKDRSAVLVRQGSRSDPGVFDPVFFSGGTRPLMDAFCLLMRQLNSALTQA